MPEWSFDPFNRSNVIDRNTNWPHVFTNTFGSFIYAQCTDAPDSDSSLDTSRNGESKGLVFPKFREELLKQSFWSPANNLGRIKLIISEGFPRNSLTNPIERIRNMVAFSFQHAPIRSSNCFVPQ